MENDDPIVEFLTREENFQTAFKVAEYVQAITEDLHARFWPLFHQQVNSLLQASEYSDRWFFMPLPTRYVFQQNGKCFLTPKIQTPIDQPFLQIGLGQGGRSDKFRLYQGVRWSKVPGDLSAIPQIVQMKEKLRLFDLTIADTQWPGWNWINYRARGEAFLVRMANEPEKITYEIAEGMWKLFLEFVPLLEAINKEIVDNYQATPA
jgi:hypothetical protein